jgi:hypothetical protein
MYFDDLIMALESLGHGDNEEAAEVIPIPLVKVVEVPPVSVKVTGIDREIVVLSGKLTAPAVPLSVPKEISERHEAYMLPDYEDAGPVFPVLSTLTRAMRRSNPGGSEQAQQECQTGKQGSKGYFQTLSIQHAIFLTLLVIEVECVPPYGTQTE